MTDTNNGGRKRQAKSWRWLVWPTVALAAVLAALAFPLALTTTVVPPPDPDQPVEVFLLDFGRTSGLVLPVNDGMAEYVYGDCNYYALGNRGVPDAIAAMIWPTRACMGRGSFPGPATRENLLRQIRVAVERVYTVRVARADVERLEARLHALYVQGLPEAIEHRGYGLTFVPHPVDYHYFHNSNHVTAAWLADLGCRVRGPAVYSRWRIADEPADPVQQMR